MSESVTQLDVMKEELRAVAISRPADRNAHFARVWPIASDRTLFDRLIGNHSATVIQTATVEIS